VTVQGIINYTREERRHAHVLGRGQVFYGLRRLSA